MKNNIIRAFVIALTLTGAAASAHTAKASAQISKPVLGAYPIPMCPPNDPNACGLGSTK